jgi:ERCC4-related helicase
MEEIKIKPREYQRKIYESCKKESCLVILPTGTGKTLIALMLAVNRFKNYPREKILILAPTRPLIEQHLSSFKKNLPEDWADLQIFTGKTNAEKRRKIWQTAEFIFSTPQCVDGETIIFTKQGPIKISEFFKKFNFEQEKCIDGMVKVAKIKEKILGYDGKTIKLLEASRALKMNKGEMIKIKTELGNHLVCTKNHPLLTINQEGEILWKKASELTKQDYIASPKKMITEILETRIIPLLSNNINLKIGDKDLTKRLIKKLKENKINCRAYSRYFFNSMPLDLFLNLSKKVNFAYDSLLLTDSCGKSNPVKIPMILDQRLAYILGAMLGEGHIGNRKRHGQEVVFSDLDRDSVSLEFKEAIVEKFGIEMKKSPKGLSIYNTALAEILNSMGIPKGRKSKIIRIPKFLFISNEDNVRGFIKGIFDTCGSAAKNHVSIASVSKEFIQDLKWLFLKIGIIGNIEEKINRGEIKGRVIKASKIFIFRFSGRKNLKNFLEIGPNKEKCDKLIKTWDNTKKLETRSKEILPILELMKKIRKDNMSKDKHYKFLCLSVDNLKRLSQKIEGKHASKLKKLLKLPIRWVKIKEKINLNGKQEVYDLTIKKHHNFISNCLISHNCISNDLKKNLYSLEDVSLLIVDECHRCLKNYAYNYISQGYKQQSKNNLILGLTASPGSDKETITKVCENLGIKNVEIRTRESEDVKPYLQELEFEKISVDFPPEFEEIRQLLKKIYEEKVQELKNRKLLYGYASKTELIKLQGRIFKTLKNNNSDGNYLMGASVCSQAIKIQHALELLETQTYSAFLNYIFDLKKQAEEKKSKGVQRLVNDKRFLMAYTLAITIDIEHPKLEKLLEIVQETMSKNKTAKIIIFAQFRDSVKKISDSLNELKGVRSKNFVGQAKKGEGKNATGLNQKEQKKIIEEFSNGEINCLVATSIAEEGLDIPEVNEVIFYEPVPSAIRTIQRAGRTARLVKGSLKILITRDTRDQAFHYASQAREKRMHKAIDSIKNEMSKKTEKIDSQKKLF